MSVMNGFVHELIDKILGTNSHLTISKFKLKNITNYTEISQKLNHYQEVKSTNLVIDGQGMIINQSTKSSTGAVIKGYDESELKTKKQIIYDSLDLHPKCKNNPFGSNKEGILIGKLLAYDLGLHAGQEISLVTSAGDNTIFGFMPRYKNLFVCGTFETKSSISDGSMAIVSLQNARNLFKYPNGVSGVEVYLKNYLDADKFADKLYYGNAWNEAISTWQTQNDGLFQAMKIERVAMGFILTLFLMVSMFGIFANMNSIIQSKQKQIAIMLSMGFTKSDVVKIFFFSGLLIGTLGTIFGGVVGVLFASNIEPIRHFIEGLTNTNLLNSAVYFLSYLPSKIEYTEVASTMLLALVFTIICSYFPARKAGKINIAETLRQI